MNAPKAKPVFGLLAVATIAIGFGLPGPVAADAELGDPDWNYELILGGGSATGNSRVLVGAIGRILTENVQGVRSTGAVVPGFDAESAIHTHSGTMHGGVGTPLIIENAIEGRDPFPPEGANLKFWFYHNEVPLNILALESLGITTIDELNGKSVALAPPGTSNYLLSEIVFNAHGVEIDDLDVRYMDTSEAISQLQNGHIDAMSYVRDYSGAVLELSTARDVVLLQPKEEALPAIEERIAWAGPVDWPFVEQYSELEAPGDALVFTSPEFMFLSGELPNDLVYAMTRAVWENIEIINRSSSVFENVNLEEALLRVPVEPHPGAIRYYKEMDVPGWEEYEHLLTE